MSQLYLYLYLNYKPLKSLNMVIPGLQVPVIVALQLSSISKSASESGFAGLSSHED